MDQLRAFQLWITAPVVEALQHFWFVPMLLVFVAVAYSLGRPDGDAGFGDFDDAGGDGGDGGSD